MRVSFLAATSLAFCLSLAAQAQTTNRLDEVLAKGVLRVGSTGDYKPFSFKASGQNDYVGLDIDLANSLAQALGVKLQVVPTTWPTLMKDFGADKFDVALSGVSISMERQKTALFSVPYMTDGKTPITRCENQAKYQTLTQINQPGVKLVVNPGGTNEKFARAKVAQAQLTVYPDNVTIFEQVANGNADLMITDAIETRLQSRLNPALCAVHPDAPFDYSEKAALLPRDLIFKAFVDQWLHQQIASGALAKNSERWLSYPWGLDSLRVLVDARLQLAPEVAKNKWNSKAPIEDLAREAQIIQGLGKQAAALGLPVAESEAFFKAQIEASKTVQREMFARWTQENQPAFDNPLELTAIRAKLDELTPKLLKALSANWAVLHDSARHRDVGRVLQPLPAAQISAAAAAQALAPLLSSR